MENFEPALIRVWRRNRKFVLLGNIYRTISRKKLHSVCILSTDYLYAKGSEFEVLSFAAEIRF